MKIKNLFPVLFMIMVVSSCKKDPANNPVVDDTIFTATCQIQELIWMADNVTVLINDRCNGNIYFFNTATKTQRTWNMAPNFLVQKFYYTKDVPGKVFFTTLSKNAAGAFVMPIQLYSMELSNFATALIRDNISENPTVGNYVLGNKKLAIKDPAGTLLIDLEFGTTQLLPVIGDVQAFSPDNTKLLFYSNYSNPITNTVTYDLGCSCTQPITLSGHGKAVWRTPGIFGYDYNSTTQSLEFQNFQTGSIVKNFTNNLTGPWLTNGSNQVLLYEKASTWSVDQDAVLISYNLSTNQTRELAHAKYLAISVLKGIYIAALSPDETKVAYAVDGSKLKLVSL